MRKACLSVVLILILSVFVGCGQRPRHEVGQVKLGMTRTEAVKILGEPQKQETTPQGGLLRWRFKDQEVLLVFNQDKVTGRQVTGRKVR